jgi:hypothetical protein
LTDATRVTVFGLSRRTIYGADWRDHSWDVFSTCSNLQEVNIEWTDTKYKYVKVKKKVRLAWKDLRKAGAYRK